MDHLIIPMFVLAPGLLSGVVPRVAVMDVGTLQGCAASGWRLTIGQKSLVDNLVVHTIICISSALYLDNIADCGLRYGTVLVVLSSCWSMLFIVSIIGVY